MLGCFDFLAKTVGFGCEDQSISPSSGIFQQRQLEQVTSPFFESPSSYVNRKYSSWLIRFWKGFTHGKNLYLQSKQHTYICISRYTVMYYHNDVLYNK